MSIRKPVAEAWERMLAAKPCDMKSPKRQMERMKRSFEAGYMSGIHAAMKQPDRNQLVQLAMDAVAETMWT